MRRPPLLILCLILALGSNAGCASAPHRQRTQSLAQTKFKADQDYRIKLREDGTAFEVKGSQLSTQGDILFVQSEDGSPVASYEARRIQAISSEGERVGSYALPGMGIGAAAVGLPLGLGFALSNCDNSGDRGDCEALRWAGALIGGFGGALFGGAVGALIGWAIPKKAKVSITPTVSQRGDETSAGMGVSLPF